MEIKIEGNPGTGNSFTEVKINHVEQYNPAATSIVNNYYGTREKSKSAEPDTNISILRKAILDYVGKLLPMISDKWKSLYMQLWNDILDLKEVSAVIYNKGKQQDTAFNRKEVAHIICYLGRYANKGDGIFIDYKPTSVVLRLGHNANCSTRPELGFGPDKEIQDAIGKMMKDKKYL